MKKPNSCSAQIWRKLSKEEQRWYKQFYNMFEVELNCLSNLHNVTKAHNLACLVVWSKNPSLIAFNNTK